MLTSAPVTAWLAAWLAFMAGVLAGTQGADPGSLIGAALAGAGAVWAGFAAAAQCRRLSPATPADRLRHAGWSIALGTIFGVLNLGANWVIADHDPALRELLLRRFALVRPIEAIVAAPLTEEVMVRLFLMSVIAWIVWRFTSRLETTFVVALIASSVVFASLHLVRPFPGSPELVSFYRASLLVKYTLAGLPMGWLFWRWGLPYAILCHALVNATHIALERFVF